MRRWEISASLAPVAAELGVGWIAVHMQGVGLAGCQLVEPGLDIAPDVDELHPRPGVGKLRPPTAAVSGDAEAAGGGGPGVAAEGAGVREARWMHAQRLNSKATTIVGRYATELRRSINRANPMPCVRH